MWMLSNFLKVKRKLGNVVTSKKKNSIEIE